MRTFGKFAIQVLVALFVLICSRAALAVAHACGWYPEQQLANMLLASPTVLEIEWVRWGLVAVITVGLWLTVDYFVYQRELRAMFNIVRQKLIKSRPVDNIAPVLENAPGVVWIKLKRGWKADWRAAPNALKRGYTPRRLRIWSGPREQLSNIARQFISERAVILQNEMLVWLRGGPPSKEPSMEEILSSIRRIISEDDPHPVKKV